MSDPAPALSFTAFVLSLASTAAIHFGDLPDPLSGESVEPKWIAAEIGRAHV